MTDLPNPIPIPPRPDAPADVPAGARARARYGAAIASSVIPGLGHLIVGRRRAGVVFIAPLLVGLIGLGIVVATQPLVRTAAYLADPAVIGAILVVEIVVLAWRILAVGAVLLDPRFPRLGLRDAIPLVLLAIVVVAPQVGLAAATATLRDSEARIFQPATSDAGAPFPTFAAASPAASAASAATASPSAEPSRLTVLLLGMDSGVGRTTALTDTMIVASLDRVARTVTMVSVPRDMVDVPLARGGSFYPKINGLVSYVAYHPDEFPGYRGNGQAVLAGALGTLLGVRIDYYAQVNLGGFVALVDSVGGVDVDVDHALCDPSYDEYGYVRSYFSIGAGRHHLSGDAALAFARIRKSAGESDFTRAARQQQILVALRDRIVHGGFLDDPLGFLRAIGDTIQTNIPPSLLPDLAPFVSGIDRSRVYETVIRYPLVHPTAVADPRGSIQIPDLGAIARLGVSLYTAPGVMPDPAFVIPPPTTAAAGPPAAAPTCSAPPPPKPTPHPTPAASGSPGPSGGPGPSASPATVASPTSAGATASPP
ncbi:MAG: LCP family protein [Candidatus Limnocylindrales bacterium]